MTFQGETDNEKVRLLREKCNHDLLKSEDEYVNMLEVIVKNVFKPLHEHSERLRLKPQHVQYVYLFLEHMLQFHVNLLSVIRDALNVVPDFYKYGNFVQMYDDYLGKFDSVLRVFSEWKSMEFRCFAAMRLENEKVKKCIEAPMLCMLPWYLYHPFERLKVYYKFLRDLESLAQEGDEDKKFLEELLVKFRKVYHKIKQNEKRLRTKTKLLEIQLQIHGDFKTIVRDDRYFIMSKPCQVRRKILQKKCKGITIYLFNDLFLWASVRGKYKGSYSLYNEQLEIEKTGATGNGEFSIGLAFEKSKRVIVCANDEQRDLIMEKIMDTFRKCQERSKNATPEEKFAYTHLSKKETQTSLENSRSSTTENSLSMSHSDIEGRINSKIGPFPPQPPLEKIAENFSLDEETNNGSEMRDRTASPPAVLAKTIEKFKEPSVDLPHILEKSNKKDIKIDETASSTKYQNVTSLSPSSERQNPVPQPQSMQPNEKNQKNSKTFSKEISISVIAENAKSRSNNTIKASNVVSSSSAETICVDKDKIIMELKQTIDDLKELVHKKDDHIKTLELSHQSIQNTLQMTKNQFTKLQQEYDILQKQSNQHGRIQSMALPSNFFNSPFNPKYTQSEIAKIHKGLSKPRASAPLQISISQFANSSDHRQQKK